MTGDRTVRIAVAEAHALTFPAGALVLKYAQHLYGVDAKAVAASGFKARRLPAVGGHTVLREPEGISAGALVFIGVVELQRFEYREIRDFAHRALRLHARCRRHATSR